MNPLLTIYLTSIEIIDLELFGKGIPLIAEKRHNGEFVMMNTIYLIVAENH